MNPILSNFNSKRFVIVIFSISALLFIFTGLIPLVYIKYIMFTDIVAELQIILSGIIMLSGAYVGIQTIDSIKNNSKKEVVKDEKVTQ